MRWVVVAVSFLVVFGVFTTVFAAAAPKSEVRVLPKWLWVLICALIPFFGGLLYLIVGRPLGRSAGFTDSTGRAKQKRVVAPDDDPNFLRDLGKRLRSEKDKPGKDEKKAERDEPSPDDESEPPGKD